MRNYFKLLIICFNVIMLLLSYISCNHDSDDDDDIISNDYLASGNYGDVIRYSLYSGTNTYLYYNETTGESGEGEFTVSEDENINGVYVVTGEDNNTYYVIELADEVMFTSIPSGNTNNQLIFGISSELDLSTEYTTEEISGRYIFITFGENSTELYWGGYEIKEDGTYTWDFGPDDTEDFDPLDHFAGSEIGTPTWAIDTAVPSRIIFSEGSETYIGTIYPGKVMLIDNGTQLGFTIGIAYPDTHYTIAEITGTYRYLDIYVRPGEECTGIGYYTIPDNTVNPIEFYYNYTNDSIGEGTGSLNTWDSVTQVNNMFYAEDPEYSAWFIILPGEVMMYFCYDTIEPNAGELISYGIGARIN